MSDTNDNRGKPCSRSNTTAFLYPSQICEQAEQKAQSLLIPDLDNMTREEILQMIYETQVNQIKADLKVEQLCSQLEERHDQADLFSIVTENMLDLVSLTDMEGNYTFAGKSHEILGYEPGFLIGKNVMDFVHPEDFPRILEAFNEFVASGHPRRVEYRNRCEDGTYLWLETVGNFIKDENGIPQKIAFSSRDITGRKQAEEALRQSENYYRAIFETSATAMCILEEDTTISRVNSNFEKLLGYSKQEVEGKKSWIEIIHPDDVEWMKENHYLALQNSNSAQNHYEFRCLTRHGEMRNLFLVIDFIPSTNQTIASCIDITEQKRAEAKRKEDERLLSNTFDAVDNLLMVIDKDHRILLCNWKDHEWVPVEEREKRPYCYKVMKNFDAPCEDCSPAKTFNDGKPRWFEDRNPIDGTYKEISAIPIFNDNGEVEYVLENIRDVSERKHTEDALRESEEKFRLTFAASPDSVNINRLEDGLYVDINRGFTRLTGFSREDVIGRTSTEIRIWHNPEDRQKLVSGLREKGFYENLEARFRRKDGSLVTALMSAAVIHINNEPHIVSITRDITELKLMEEALRRSEEKHRRLFETMAQGVIHQDAEGSIISANPAAEKILGLSLDQMLGKTSMDPRLKIIKEDGSEVPGSEHPAMIALQTGQAIGPVTRGIFNPDKNNHTWLSITAIPLSQPGETSPFQVYSTFEDITERKQAEAEQEKLQTQLNEAQKMESIGRLAGGVAHDFNNMLSIINGYAEISIDMLEPSEPVYANIREIYNAGKRSEDIVRQLLAFARRQTISPVQLDLNDTVSGMIKMLQRLIGENIELAWHPGNNLWRVKVDPSQLDQIMANLAVNARDAINDVGRLTIETKNVVVDQDYCRWHSDFVPGRYVMLAVSDNGCGMEKEIQDNLFEPFFTTKGSGKGTGLGLSTIYGIVKQNKGFINVYSEPGQGTSFKIYLPAHEEAESGASQHLKEPMQQLPTGSETVMLVEDEPAILKMGKGMLEKLGYTVLTAEKPDDALRLAEEYEGRIHLLITDVVMPEMNGRDLSAKLSDCSPGLKSIYMSGYTADVIAHHGVLDEDLHFIQKPFSIQDLAVKVREAIEQQ